jgi:hypothetical protein
MAIRHTKSTRRSKRLAGFLDITHNVPNLTPRSLRLEPFEERILFALNPHLVAILPNPSAVLTDGQTLHSAPTELTFRFDSNIDPASLLSNPLQPGIQLRRAGVDGLIGTPDDPLVVPSYMAIGDNPNEVIVRFAQTSSRQPFTLADGTPLPDSNLLDPTLPNDLYQIRIVGAGANPLRGTNGAAFNAGVDVTQKFTLDLGAQVVAVVPQPITRGNDGKLAQNLDQIVVYFNANDTLDLASARNVANYELIPTMNGAEAPITQSIKNPVTVDYDPNAHNGVVTLTFAPGVLSTTINVPTTAGIYRLRIGNSEPLPVATQDLGVGTAGSSLATARVLGTLFPSLQGTQSVSVEGTIAGSPVNVVYPGSDAEPGIRNINNESHVTIAPSVDGVVPVYFYNFQQVIGTVGGATAFNSITEAQKERFREALSYYGAYLGVEFVETSDSGLTFATGDTRAVSPNVQPAAIQGAARTAGTSPLAVVNAGVDWGKSEAGGSYFREVMDLVGKMLGLGDTDEAPPLNSVGDSAPLGDSAEAEPVFPGNSDILLGQYLHPPVGNDINLYRFALPRAGQINLETLAERLPSQDPNDPVLDSVISVFDSTGKLIARNDDYYGTDSFLQLQLSAGTYYVGVTSKGNTNFDPTIAGTGFGGTTQGQYQLKLSFTPTPAAGIRDTSQTLIDGDGDGTPGGTFNFWFRLADPNTSATVHTIYVDKVSAGGPGLLGTLANPYTNIGDALAHAIPGDVVRIVGNGGADKTLSTIGDNQSYNIGFDNIGQPLSDGTTLEVPRGVTVMIDAGAIIKLHSANIDVGSSAQGIDRSSGALQVLGVPTGFLNNASNPAFRDDAGSVYFTSYYNNQIGTDPGTAKDAAPASGNWGGLVFRDDPSLSLPGDQDLEAAGVFLNSVNHANLSFGGGKVVVNSVEQAYAPIHLVTSRPTITNNIITNSADAAVSADPNSFQESEFQNAQFSYDYTRSGPNIHGNSLANNSLNGLFVRVGTTTPPVGTPDQSEPQGNGEFLTPLTVSARFSTTDMPYIIKENLLIAGAPGGGLIDGTGFHTRQSARLAIDPGVIVKLGGARIETQMGAQFIAEGTTARPIIFTSLFDDRYGSGGSFDTTSDNATPTHQNANEGDWGGLYFGALATASLDHVLVSYAGGSTTIEGGFAKFNAVEIQGAQARIANSTFEHNGAGPDEVAAADRDDRNGRLWSAPAIIFVRGAQPVLIDNIIENNDTAPITDPNANLKDTAAISIDLNSLNARQVSDWGRSTGLANIQRPSLTNTGPLVRGNQIANTPINGMLVRGGTLTTNGIWDDTDITHVLLDEVIAGNQYSVNGTLRLQSTSTESLVVKLGGASAGFTASGTPLDINDRIGGTVQIIGQPNHPVVLTSVFDTTVGAGFTPDGTANTDTHNANSANTPDLPTTSGPVFLDGGDRDDHGFRNSDGNQNGWKFIEQALNFAVTNSKNTTAERGILVIGVHEDAQNPTQAELAIKAAADAIGFSDANGQGDPTKSLDIVSGNDISGVDFTKYKAIYVPSDGLDTFGGITDTDMALLTARKLDIQSYINVTGGGLVALTEDGSADPYSWLALPDPFEIQHGGGVDLTQTPALAAAGFDITDKELSLGTPWHNSFVGPSGFNRLVPLVIDPNTGAVVTLGLASGAGGVGPRAANPAPGDWSSIKLDTYSNDTNVDVINELEQGFAPTGDTNSLPTTAQFIGTLAKDTKSGDDNLRLGFEIHGSISQTVANVGFGDADVYSFKATAGTPVWFDIDKTSSSLDTVVELIDANGSVIARSDNSLTETQNPGQLVGIAKPMQTGFSGSASPFSNPDFYSTNPLDAGMRVDLPGTAGAVNTYFVRVRASSPDLTRLNGGLTKGDYQLQIRLQSTDVFPGSVVRNADIRYALTGVEIIGKPEHSPLMGDTGETSLGHNTFDTAQDLGNLLTSDTNAISVAGNLAANDVDWYKFDLNYDLVSSIAGSTDGPRFFPTMFQINYADGLARPDTTLSVFDQFGNLLYLGRDSDNADSLPRSSLGTDPSNTAHGSFGTLDPTIGSVELPAGSPAAAGADGANAHFTYYVAVTASNKLPTVLDATFKANATNPLVRLQPLSSVTRVFDDSIGSTSTPSGQQAFPGTTPSQLNLNATPLNLADVVMFVTDGDKLYTANPFTGQFETYITTAGLTNALLPSANNRLYTDMAMRPDGRLMMIPNGTDAATDGTYVQIDAGDGSAVSSDAGGIGGSATISVNDVDETTNLLNDGTYSFTGVNNGTVKFSAMAIGHESFISSWNNVANLALYVVGKRSAGNGTIGETQNLLFRRDVTTGAYFSSDLESTVTQGAHNVYQPFPPVSGSTNPVGPGSGTDVIPRGTLTTGLQMFAKDGSTLVDGAKFTLTYQTFIPPQTPPNNTPNNDFLFKTVTFEFDSNGITSPGTDVVIPFTPADSATQLASDVANAINGAGKFASVPGQIDPQTQKPTLLPVSAAVSGVTITLTNALFDVDRFNNLLPGWTDGSADIEGLAFLPVDTSAFQFAPDDMYAVSSNGAIYSVTNYEFNDSAQLHLLNIVTNNGRTVHFTGLTAGPPDVENGRYQRTLFATDTEGNIWAFNDQGQPAPVFLDGATKVSTGIGFLEGLAFSSLDSNLWHATTTHGSDPATATSLAGSDVGNTSFYFGLENANIHSLDDPHALQSAYWQPGATQYVPGDVPIVGRSTWQGNPAILSRVPDATGGGSYNLPGGALGSLTTRQFDLSSYSAGDKPTLYFDYAADTESAVANTSPANGQNGQGGGSMRDSFRVFASSDGANWTLLGTNNSLPSDELPAVPSVDKTQELFDTTGIVDPRLQLLPGAATTVGNWRQARIDLGSFAGKSGVQIRFDFSTAGSMGIGDTMQGGVYLAGTAAANIANGAAFVIDNSRQVGFSPTTGPIYSTTNSTFVFRSGFILQAPAGGGKMIANGETFTVNGKTYEFTRTGSVSGANVAVLINDSQTAEGVATAIQTAINSSPISGVTPLRVGDRVQLQAATTVAQSAVHALIVQGAAMPGSLARTDIPYTIDMTAENIANEVAKALDRQFSFINGNTDDPNNFTSSKVNGRTIRLYGHNVVSAGPLPYSNVLPGDDQGRFTVASVFDPGSGVMINHHIEAADRGLDNAHQGVFIDNVILGFAGRGEQVLDSQLAPPIDPTAPPPPTLSVTTFDTVPNTGSGAHVATGPYQLSLRRGTEYVPGASIVTNGGTAVQFAQGQTADINDRLAQGITIYAVPASQLRDGQTFSIAVEGGVFTFEFEALNASNLGNGVASGNIAVPFRTNDDARAVAVAIRDAINNVAGALFGVKAGLNIPTTGPFLTSAAVNLFGAQDVQTGGLRSKFFGQDISFQNTLLPVLGDANPTRIQGQTIVQGVQISNTLQTGISVLPEVGESTETGIPQIGSPGHTGSVANLGVLNSTQLVPGITLKNNLIVRGGITGILFSGSPKTDIAHAVPFGRIENNTVFGSNNGIIVANNASPTILNNIIANTKVGLTVDGTSNTTVVGANLYQGNAKDKSLGSVIETNAIVLQPTDPLFVDTSKNNFYLKANSLAIDSSVNSLQERPALQAVTAPLGIAASQILAPDFDLFGQLRVDDSGVPSFPGLGSNVFKDRGAIERADVLGPTASLLNPVDNDPAAVDRNTAVNKVSIVARLLNEFALQLNDGGIGVDESTVDASKFAIVFRSPAGQTKTLVPGVDYTLAFDATSSIARLIPATGQWPLGTYTITLANGASPAAIKDTAGNSLQPNDPSGATQFVIQETTVPVSPWQNQTNPADVNGSGTVSGIDALLIINRLLLGQTGPIPITTAAPPYIDANGDGSLTASDALFVINFLITHPAGSAQAQSLVTSADAGAGIPSAAPAAVASPMAASNAAPVGDDGGVASGIALAQMADTSADSPAVGSTADYLASAQPMAAVSPQAAATAAAFASDSLADDSDPEFEDTLADLADEPGQLQTI